jgi:hypothetical protein
LYQTVVTPTKPQTDRVAPTPIAGFAYPSWWDRLKVRIFSTIADGGLMRDRRGHSTITVWFFVRMLDISQGAASGGAKFGLEQAAAFFGTTPNAMRQRLYKAKRKGFLRHVRINKRGIVTVYYTSLFKVAQLMGLPDLGFSDDVSSACLKSISVLKQVAIALHVQGMQQGSYYIARNKAGDNRDNVLTAEDLLSSLPLKSRESRVLHRSSKRVFVSSDVVPHGCSHYGVGLKVGRHRRTIINRMRGCDRRQVCQEAPSDDYGLMQFIDSEQIAALSLSRRYFVSGDRLFKALTNVYALDFELKSLKRSRGFYKRFLASGKLPHSERLLSRSSDSFEIMSWAEYTSEGA